MEALAAGVSRLTTLEGVIERGLQTFVEVGNALEEIRAERLYKPDYPTFEAYCRERWGLKQSRAYQLLDAAAVVRNLETSTIVELPKNEAQARHLTLLKPDEQREAWSTAVATAPEGKVTAKHVAATVRAMKHTDPIPTVPDDEADEEVSTNDPPNVAGFLYGLSTILHVTEAHDAATVAEFRKAGATAAALRLERLRVGKLIAWLQEYVEA